MIQKTFEEACRIAQRKGEITRAVDMFGGDITTVASAVVTFKQKDTGVEVSVPLNTDNIASIICDLAREQQALEHRFSSL